MKPILYPSSETVFDTNGIGILTDTIECHVLPVLNGQYELTLRYPATGVHYNELMRRAIILAKPDPVSEPQPFRIYRRVPSSNGTITVYARHIAYDLTGVVVSPFSATGAPAAMQALAANAVTDCPFTFWTDKSTAATMDVAVPAAIWTLLGNSEGSVLDCYGGEYEFDRFTVKLWNRRGADRGVTIRYGKNLTSLEMDESIANTYTGVYPYWLGSDGSLVQLTEKILNASGTYDHTRIMPLDLSQEFTEAPTEEQLRERAEKYITDNDIGTPSVSWKIQHVDLEKTEEYKGKAILERVLLGDTVSVEFADMGVSASARVVAADYDPIREQYNSITLGRVRANLATTIVQQKQEIQKKPSISMMERVSMMLMSAIMGAKGGAVRLLDTDGDGMPDELYIGDNADPALAVKVWRFNYEGWAASQTGYNGPFVLGATLDGGILAHWVTACSLVAGTITSADGKTFFLDLDNGILKMQATEFSISGKTVDEIAQEKADEAEDNAVGQAVTIAQNAVDGQTQEDIFNKLSNNGQMQGLFLLSGEVYLNLRYAKAGSFTSSASVFLEPGQEEFDAIKNHLLGTATISDTALYDFDNSGAIGATDLVKCKQAMLGQISLASWSGAKKSTVTVTIDASNTQKAIRISGTNMWGREVEYYIGFSGASLGTILGNLAVGGVLNVGGDLNIDGDLTADGATTLNGACYVGSEMLFDTLPDTCEENRLYLVKVAT